MSDTYISFKLSSEEAFLLLKLMGFNELLGFSNPFINDSQEEMNQSLMNAKQQLLGEKLIYETEGRIELDPTVYTILQGCKLCERVSWLNIVRDEKIYDYYYFISSQQVIELTEEFSDQSSSVEFKLIGNIYDYFVEILANIDSPNEECSLTFRDSISLESLNFIVNNLKHASLKELESYVLEEGASIPFAKELVKGFKHNIAIGQLVYFLKTVDGWNTKGMKFLIEPNGNWLFTQSDQDNIKDIFHAECFNRNEFYQSVIEEAVSSAKQFSY
ncbi:hypothetical protein AF332_14835 [Sporosarcina globispora]|uniref:Uncharacterized protein n=1 Tax=Sporosarcina globispora TaxID=1459 RepID=A0A0M0GDR0_SPOGL|nr:hypothetical protein [Sporosarcina globispora]KON87974.1 hypothetical protein AF332_14835 [Sporosarcina globispora]